VIVLFDAVLGEHFQVIFTERLLLDHEVKHAGRGVLAALSCQPDIRNPALSANLVGEKLVQEIITRL